MCQWKISKVGHNLRNFEPSLHHYLLLYEKVRERERACCRRPTPSWDLGDVTWTSEGARYTDARSLRPPKSICLHAEQGHNWQELMTAPVSVNRGPCLCSALCLTTSGRIIGFHAYNSALDLSLQINWPTRALEERRRPPRVRIRNQMTS